MSVEHLDLNSGLSSPGLYVFRHIVMSAPNGVVVRCSHPSVDGVDVAVDAVTHEVFNDVQVTVTCRQM